MGKKRITDFEEKESLLLEMISDSLTLKSEEIGNTENTNSSLLHGLTEFAAHQSVLPIIYHRLLKEKNLAAEDREYLEMMVQEKAAKFYQILFNARSSIELLRKNGVSVALLKGASVACFYPVPESRKSSDIDLFLLRSEDVSAACQIFEANGYRQITEGQTEHANPHELWGTPDRHLLELHTMLVKPTEDRNFNEYVAKRFALSGDALLEKNVLGFSLPVFPDDCLAFHLLLHMRMDFFASGFGLKLLCDWVVFWNRKVEPALVENFLRDVEKCGMKNFLSVITSVCISYLGLSADGSGTLVEKDGDYFYENGLFCKKAEENLVHDFLQDVFDAERHGKPGGDRMMALQDTGILSYIRSFHHLTKLYFPKASRWVVTLPFLYIFVFVRFLYNNHKIRGGQSVSAVISSTKKRSELAKQLFSKTL